MTLRALPLLLACCAASAAWAQTPPAEAPAQAPAAAPAGRPAPGEDIELLPPPRVDEAERARAAQIEREVAARRTLLQLHQAGGLVLLASLGTTVVLGQLDYADKYGGGGDTGKYHSAHKVAAYTSAGIFAATGLLALLAPTPFEKPLRLDTVTLHKAAMAAATAGMVAEIVLGIVTAQREGRISQRDFALAHQIIGYTTLAATSAGVLVFTF